MTKNIKPSIKPLGNRVLIQLVEETEQIVGGIVIPDSAKEKPQQAKVIALGTGKLDDANKPLPFNVKEGDIVIISRYGGTEVKLGDEKYQLVSEDDILGVLA